MNKQDGYASRTAADLERKYNFGRTFAEVYGLVRDAQTTAEEAKDAIDGLDTEEIFNRLTNYGEYQGIYRGDDGGVYINASFIKSGTISGDSVKVEAATITGKLVATQIDAKDLKVLAANIDGVLSANQIEMTGTISWGDLDTGTQEIINSATTLAGNAAIAASAASNKVNAWAYEYNGHTYIDGRQLMTGTVKASQLLGGYVGLLNTAEQPVGQMSIGLGNEGYAIELISTGGGLRMQSATNFWVTSAYGSMGITASGAIFSAPPIPIGGGMVSLGTSSFLWSAVYAQTGQIVTSDRQKKNTISYDLERYSALFDKLRPVSYKLNTNQSNRTHIGFISQDVEQSLEDVGISSQDFAGFIKSHRRDEEGNVVDGKYDYALRYEEFIALNTMEIQKLKARVAALEEKLA